MVSDGDGLADERWMCGWTGCLLYNYEMKNTPHARIKRSNANEIFDLKLMSKFVWHDFFSVWKELFFFLLKLREKETKSPKFGIYCIIKYLLDWLWSNSFPILNTLKFPFLNKSENRPQKPESESKSETLIQHKCFLYMNFIQLPSVYRMD